MASQATTEILIELGHVPNPSGTQISIDLVTGLQKMSELKEQIKNRTGEDPLAFKAYLTIPCSSQGAAEALSAHLKKTHDDAIANTDSMIGSVFQKLKPDADEPSFATFQFSSYLHNAVIVVTFDMYHEQAEAMFEMAVSQAGELFNTNNSLHIEIDTGRSAGEILTPNLGQMLSESALFKITFSHEPRAFLHAREVAQGLGANPRLNKALAYASLYSGASLKLNFKSGSHLPETAQGMLTALSANIPSLAGMLPPEVTAFVHGIIEHSGHELFINVVAGNIAAEVHLSLKGASQIFQANN